MDATRLDRLLDRYGSGFSIRGDSARFRALLKAIDNRPGEHIYDSEEEYDAFQMNEQDSQAEEIRFSKWRKKPRRAAAQVPKQKPALSGAGKEPQPSTSRPWNPENPADDRNWTFGEGQEKEEEAPGSED